MAAVRVQRVARAAVVALVEGQEVGVARPSSRVVMWTSLLLTAKCTSAPLGKREQRLGGLALGLAGGGRSGTGRSRPRRSA